MHRFGTVHGRSGGHAAAVRSSPPRLPACAPRPLAKHHITSLPGVRLVSRNRNRQRNISSYRDGQKLNDISMIRQRSCKSKSMILACNVDFFRNVSLTKPLKRWWPPPTPSTGPGVATKAEAAAMRDVATAAESPTLAIVVAIACCCCRNLKQLPLLRTCALSPPKSLARQNLVQ